MPGTPKGGLKTADTNKAKYGADYYSKIGRLGGSFKNPNKGFGSSRERAIWAGKKGGAVSKRNKKV